MEESGIDPVEMPEVDIVKLEKGENTIILSRSFGKVSTLEAVYLLGDFGVKVIGREKIITELPEKLGFGSIVNQGLPFYGGNVTYTVTLERGKEKWILS